MNLARPLPGMAARLAPLAIVLGDFALRVFRLDFQELRGDEAFGYFFSLQPPGDIVRATLALREPHPVASYVLQHGWLQAAGHSEFAVRFLSAWFGALAVALIYRLARAAGLTRGSAAAAAALLALSPYAIWHSQDARMYSISLALTLASTLLALRFVARPSVSVGAAYVLASLAALHTHYFTAFVLLAQNLWVAWQVVRTRSRPLVLGWVGVQAALAALYLPWLMVAAGTLTAYHGNGDSPGAMAALLRTGRVFLAGEMAPARVQIAALVAGLALLALLLVGRAHRRPNAAVLGLIALTALVPLLATWLSAQSRPIFNERYLIAAVPGVYILLGAALDRAPLPGGVWEGARRRAAGLALVAVLVAGLVGAGFYYFDPVYSKSRGWRELGAALEGFTRGFPEGSAWVVENTPDPTLWYYYPPQRERWVLPPGPQDKAGADRVAEDLVRAGVRRVVIPLVADTSWDGAGIATGALEQRYQLLLEEPVAGWRVAVMESLPPDPRRTGVEFDGGLRLESAGWQPEEPRAGGLLGVHLRWSEAGDRAPAGAKVTVQLLDAGGALVAQADAPLRRDAGWSSHPLRLPSGLPSGQYRLIAALYDPDAPGLPRLRTNAGTDLAELGVVTIR